jgi:hypothetical protein
MDEICAAIAAKIFTASGGEYAILYEDELLDAIADETQKNREVLQAALKVLINGGYIDVKYARGDVFCIAALKKYEQPQPISEIKKPTSARTFFGKEFLLAFLGGLLGGTAGAIAGGIIAALAL